MTNQGDTIEAIVKRFIDEVREHSDAVQVHVSYAPEEEHHDTACLDMGSGNWYARVGMAQEFLCKNSARIRKNVSKED